MNCTHNVLKFYLIVRIICHIIIIYSSICTHIIVFVLILPLFFYFTAYIFFYELCNNNIYIMNSIITSLINHIKAWNMVWFGLIFWGSVLNAFAREFGLLTNNPDLSYLFFLLGLILGLTAKFRGTWLWIPAK